MCIWYRHSPTRPCFVFVVFLSASTNHASRYHFLHFFCFCFPITLSSIPLTAIALDSGRSRYRPKRLLPCLLPVLKYIQLIEELFYTCKLFIQLTISKSDGLYKDQSNCYLIKEK